MSLLEIEFNGTNFIRNPSALKTLVIRQAEGILEILEKDREMRQYFLRLKGNLKKGAIIKAKLNIRGITRDLSVEIINEGADLINIFFLKVKILINLSDEGINRIPDILIEIDCIENDGYFFKAKLLVDKSTGIGILLIEKLLRKRQSQRIELITVEGLNDYLKIDDKNGLSNKFLIENNFIILKAYAYLIGGELECGGYILNISQNGLLGCFRKRDRSGHLIKYSTILTTQNVSHELCIQTGKKRLIVIYNNYNFRYEVIINGEVYILIAFSFLILENNINDYNSELSSIKSTLGDQIRCGFLLN